MPQQIDAIGNAFRMEERISRTMVATFEVFIYPAVG